MTSSNDSTTNETAHQGGRPCIIVGALEEAFCDDLGRGVPLKHVGDRYGISYTTAKRTSKRLADKIEDRRILHRAKAEVVVKNAGRR